VVRSLHRMINGLAVICAAAWIYLICARGQFWTGRIRDCARQPEPRTWPSIAAIIPARNEADTIAASLKSLLRQHYPGRLTVIVVDDDSCDGTTAIAMAAAAGSARQMGVVTSHGPPAGWTGKLWALKQGIAAAEASRPDYLLLTDADIVHAPDTLAWLTKQSLAGGYVLTSLMAKLRCQSPAERGLVPAFVYFFQMLFPFRWVCQAQSSMAAAAGGCMLIRADALRRVGGIDSVRNALIDDCALAAQLKAIGPIWLGLTDRVRSIRPYHTFADVKRMISRSAYAQLGYSPPLLVATVAGMALIFLAPPLLAIFASGWAQVLGWATWLSMALSFRPMLRFYRLSWLWGLALPMIATLYVSYTIDSAYQHLRRRGGQWKGRIHVNAPSLQ